MLLLFVALFVVAVAVRRRYSSSAPWSLLLFGSVVPGGLSVVVWSRIASGRRLSA
ncbi:hypothetical protein [Corynebacterium glyciniphilum]|uniref:hypothetical protein n=1 Tax=Corynebacterium glyciniphilum TaxID=1404244 RepID=UPI003FD2D108